MHLCSLASEEWHTTQYDKASACRVRLVLSYTLPHKKCVWNFANKSAQVSVHLRSVTQFLRVQYTARPKKKIHNDLDTVVTNPLAFSHRDSALSLPRRLAFYAAFVCSHWIKQRQIKAMPVCYCMHVLRNQKRCDYPHHDFEICVFLFFFNMFPLISVNLNMYRPTVDNHIDAVMTCCDWDPDPPCIMESDKVTFIALNYII